MTINDLDFDDDQLEEQNEVTPEEQQEEVTNQEEEVQEQSQEEEPSQPSQQQEQVEENSEEDIVTTLLKSKGIEDPTKIKFEEDNGELVERSWDSLSRDEQLNILKQEEQRDSNTDLDDAEINLINKLRSNRLTPEEYENFLINQGINKQRELDNSQASQYKIDDIADDELFVLDLQARFDTITDEEALEALNKAKQDETLYKKQIDGIREEYKRIEDDKNKREQFEVEENQKEQFQAFSNQVLQSISDFDSIGNLDIELDKDDKDDLAQFLLSADGAGVNYFSKALNDPNTLVKMAWFALKGEDAFNNITDYFTNEIKQREQNSYKRGLEDAKKKTSNKKVVYSPKVNNINKQNRQYLTINDLD